MTITGLSGSVLVTRNGRPVLQESAGVADRATGDPCTPDTRFQIASVSKQVTAASALLLVEDGFVELADRLGDVLPGCPRRWADLTLHQLLSHTSGLGHWPDLPDFDVTRPGSPEEFLARFAEVPLLSDPGTSWRYSSPGYLLAARVVEVVSGTAYARFVAERILRRVGLTETVVGREPRAQAARGYRVGERVDVPEFAAIPGTGDVWSTPGDLVRWTAALAAGQVVGAETLAAMTGPQAELDQPVGADDPAPASAYGYGLFLGTVGGHRAWFHPGDNPGHQSFLARLLDQDVTIAILANDEESDLDGVLRQLGPLLDGAGVALT